MNQKEIDSKREALFGCLHDRGRYASEANTSEAFDNILEFCFDAIKLAAELRAEFIRKGK